MKAETIRNLIRQLKAVVADLDAPENTLMIKIGGDWVTITDPAMAAQALSAKWGGHWTLTHREERPIHGPYFTNFESKPNVAISRGKEKFTQESFEAAMRDMNRITQEQREARQFNMHRYAEQMQLLPRIFNTPPRTMEELGFPPVQPGQATPVPTRPFTADSDVNTPRPTVQRDNIQLTLKDTPRDACCQDCRLTPARLWQAADGSVMICNTCIGKPMKR